MKNQEEEMRKGCEQLKDLAKTFMGQWKQNHHGGHGGKGFCKFNDTREQWLMNKAIFVKTDK